MPGDFCGDSFAENTEEIILITDQVETEVNNLYRKIVSLQSDGGERGQLYRETLMVYANLRTDLDGVLRKLSSPTALEVAEEKRIIIGGLTQTSARQG